MNDESSKTQNASNPTPKKPRPLAVKTFGWIGVVFGGLILALYVVQRLNDGEPGILELVFGLFLIIGGFSMTRKK
jgi:hypothetical protein